MEMQYGRQPIAVCSRIQKLKKNLKLIRGAGAVMHVNEFSIVSASLNSSTAYPFQLCFKANFKYLLSKLIK